MNSGFILALVVCLCSLSLWAVDDTGGGRGDDQLFFSSKSPGGKQPALPDLRAGCKAINSCGKTNNRNKFKNSQTKSVNCNSGKRCPGEMKRVCHEGYKIDICVDVNLVHGEHCFDKTETLNGKKFQDGQCVKGPQGNFSRNKCEDYCKSKGKRLLTNNEWLLAAGGTDEKKCLPTKSYYPFKNDADRKKLKYNFAGIREDRSQCVSHFGIKDAVGVLGQWVSDTEPDGKGRFNGGLWPQKSSTLFYRTVRHGPSYYDYSIGCRCAK